MARKNALISVVRDDETNALTFTVGEAGSFTVSVNSLSDEIRTHALVHGIVQKVSDAAAIPKDELSGDPEKDAVTKFSRMAAVAERLGNGDWSMRSGDGSGPVAGIIYRAFEQWVLAKAAKAKKPVPKTDAIRALYDRMERKDQLALRNNTEIAAIMDTLRAEKSKSNVNTDELLGELGL